MIQPEEWVAKQYPRLRTFGWHKYTLYTTAGAFLSSLLLLVSARYLYFPYVWICLAIVGIVLSPLVVGAVLVTSTYVHESFSGPKDREMPDTWREHELHKLKRKHIRSVFGQGLLYVSWLRIFPRLPLHITRVHEYLVYSFTGIWIVCWAMYEVRGDARRRRMQATSPSLHHIAHHVNALMRSTTPDAFVMIRVQGTDDFIQFSGDRHGIQMDFPMITEHQQELRPLIEQTCHQLGLSLTVNIGSDGTEFLDYELQGTRESIAETIKTIFQHVFHVDESQPLEFQAHGY